MAPAKNPPICAPLSTFGIANPYIKLMKTVLFMLLKAVQKNDIILLLVAVLVTHLQGIH